MLQYLQAVNLWQFQVEQEHRWVIAGPLPEFPTAIKVIECLLAVPRNNNFVAKVVFLECTQSEIKVLRIVLDHQNTPEIRAHGADLLTALVMKHKTLNRHQSGFRPRPDLHGD